MCLGKYGYEVSNITTLLDSEGTPQECWPTREHIVSWL